MTPAPPFPSEMAPMPSASSPMFAGGLGFPAALLGLPVPPFPDVIFTRNQTPHATGLAGATVQDTWTS